MFDTDKLTAFNGERIRDLDEGDLAERLEPFVARAAGGALDDAGRETVRGLVPLVQERMQRLDEVVDYAGPFLADEVTIEGSVSVEINSVLDLFEQVKLAFDEADITIPFPQRDVHLFQNSQ